MKPVQARVRAMAAFFGVMSATAMAASGAANYQITKSIALGAPDRWDYVVYDQSSHRVFVSHGDRVTVVDALSGTIVGEVSGFPGGTHGIAIVAAANRGYTDDGRAGIAASFALSTFKVEKKLQAHEDADALAFDPVSGHVFVVDGDPGLLTVIDPKTDAVIATVNLGGKLEYAVSGNNGKLYVNGEEKREIVRVDTKTNLADAHWPIPACESPHGLAIDTESHRLFSSCVNRVMVVVNADTGAVVATLPIGKGTDAAAFDAKRKLAFSSNGQDGSLSVIQEKGPNTFEVVNTIKTAVSGRTMDVDPQTGRIFIAAADVDTHAPAPAPAPAAPPAAPPSVPIGTPAGPPRGRLPIVPGSLKLLFLDPVP
jgi:YVTN family beta-propeller protein